MTHRFAWLATLVFVGAATTPVHAKGPLKLAPSSQWHVNYAPDSCRLARAFGTGDQEVVLVLDRFQPGPTVYMTLAGQPVKVRGDVRGITLRFGPNDPEFKKEFTPGTLDSGKAALVLTGGMLVTGYDPAWEEAQKGEKLHKTPTIDPALYSAIRYLELRIAGKPTVLLETGSMAAAEEALAACTDDLLRGWAIDVEAHKNLSRPATPVGSPGRWMVNADYPPAMLNQRNQGLVYFRLIVDDMGKPKSCHIQLSTRPKDFEDAVCNGIMKRASFEPALDAAGKPVASYYLNRVRFMM